MQNNDILRRIRYIFDLSDDKMMKAFAEGGMEATRADVSSWLKREEDEDFKSLYDKHLATFLNGFITMKRGRREGPQPKAEKTLNNNLILRKIKIALNFRDDDILGVLKLADFRLSKHELSAFFRKPGQSQYRLCLDQVLRRFLQGLQLHFRKEDIDLIREEILKEEIREKRKD